MEQNRHRAQAADPVQISVSIMLTSDGSSNINQLSANQLKAYNQNRKRKTNSFIAMPKFSDSSAQPWCLKENLMILNYWVH